MSVLVKGMEKPEHCGYCRFRYDGICHALQKTQYGMNECPLAVIDDAGLNDTISRQAAIDEIGEKADEIYKTKQKGATYPHDDFFQGMAYAEDVVTNLPSAQPERTCVNCGRTVNNGGWYADGRTRCPIEEHYALPKDGYCHLWEKRSVTDDDYPERREDERPES